MKLVDLDEIEYFTLVDKLGVPRYKIEIGDGLPIVKAIPIEWIEQQIKTVCDNIEAETFGKWLIKEWEKENGK